MSDTDGKKHLGLGGGAPSAGQVKQSFSHGRTKSVVVETKRKRVVVPKPGAGASSSDNAPAAKPAAIGGASRRPAGISDSEMERRLAAVRAAKAREAGEAIQRAEDERQREEDRERRRAEIEDRERE